MKKLIFIFLSCLYVQLMPAQIFKNAEKILKGQNSSGKVSENEAAGGIKDALIQGAKEAVKSVSNVDGYFGNPQIKIPFPEDAKQIESKLRAIGLGDKVDEVILTINRAAEDAAKEATAIFISAVKKMTVRDALNIVYGPNDAATNYLRNTSSTELTSKFQPHIKNSLEKVQATKYWDDIINTYNKIPLVEKMNPDLAQYVTRKAIDGLFVMVAKEELRIRKDPVARTTALLRKVFGGR